MANRDKSVQEQYGVAEVSRLLAVSQRTLRYYEEIGLVRRVARVGRNRVYTANDLRQLRFIEHLKVLGLSLGEIRELGELYRLKQSNSQVLQRLLELLDQHEERIRQNLLSLSALQEEIQSYRQRIESKLRNGAIT